MKTDSNPPLPPADHEAIEAAAAVWLSLRDRGLDESETAEFMRWLQQDARHADTFNALDRTWRDFNRIAAARPTGVAEPDLLTPRLRPRRRLAATFGPALAAAAALALAWVGFQQFHGARPTAETVIGAYQRLDLPDGSVVQLNTDSAVDVKYSDTERRVILRRGEAHFTVAKNPARPFVVGAAGVAVRAVGTAFNVRLRPDNVEVLVTEGRVQVNDAARGNSLLGQTGQGEPSLLQKGEKAVVPAEPPEVDAVAAPPAVVIPVVPEEVERALAWQERRLMFEGTPLGEAVEEFNRHNTHKLVVADPRLAGQRFGGTFRADGYEAFVALLEANFGVAAERHEGRTLLRLAP